MKYIRTKDGIFEVILVSPLGFVRIDKRDGTYPDVFEKDTLKQADTIEELCDGFWWENEMYSEPIFIPNYLIALDKIDAWKENDKELKSNSFDRITIYGSVYIRGYGWKHVCKVNKNKGELELL